MSCGFFITFEGLDGSGKSTQLIGLKAWLEERGERVTATRQPGGTHFGDTLRELLLDSRTHGLAPLAELGLMFADRAQSIAEVIAPALERGDVVLCDRFTDSTEAYQGGGRQLGSRIVLELHARLCGGLQPDLTFLLLPNLQRALQRARRRNARGATAGAPGANEGRFEGEDQAFYQRVLAKYREIAARESGRVAVIESEGSIREVGEQIIRLTEERLQLRAALGKSRP